MLKKIAFFVLILSMATCKGMSNKMILEGVAPENNSGEYVYLYDSEMGKLLDSTQIVNGEFVLTTVVEKPTLCHLSTRRHLIYFIAENEKLFIDLKKNESPYVCGSKLNDELAVLLGKQNEIKDEFESKVKSLMSDANLSEDEAYTKRAELRNEFDAKNEALMKEYLPKHQNDVLGKFIEYTLNMQQGVVGDSGSTGGVGFSGVGSTATGIEDSGVDPAGNESQYKENQHEYSYDSPAIGSLYKNLVGINSQNPDEELELAKFLGKGNYVIVHMWASFCAPCRAEVPYLAEVYKKYRSKGLEIVAIGTDVKLDTHLKLGKEMNITWPQIYDKYGKVPEVYSLDPTHLYIYDGEGKVIAKGIPGKDLDAFLSELYK